MAQEGLVLAQRSLDAYNRWDVEPVLEHLDAQVEWRPAVPMLLGGQATVYRGHDGVRAMFREIRDSFGEIRIEFDEIRDLGDRVIGIGRMRTRGTASGIETETPWALLAELEDGKGIRIQTYLDPKEALADAGLAG
jgi:ketosteroid isomerase-like protein